MSPLSWFRCGVALLALGGALAPLYGQVSEDSSHGIPDQGGGAPQEQQNSSSTMVQREIDRRRETTFRMNETLRMADKLFQAGEWDASQLRYKEVLGETDPEGYFAGFHARARVGLARALTAKALDKEQAGNLSEAAGLIKEAADLDPHNSLLAKRSLDLQQKAARAADPYPGNAAVTADLLDQTAKIKQLLSLARQLEETGQFLKARQQLDDILRIDPYNREARRVIEEVEDARMKSANLRYEASRTKALAKVTEAWLPPPAPVIGARTPRGTSSTESSKAMEVLKSLGSIRIPELVFNEEPIRSAVAQLQKLSEQYDPNKKGINFVLRLPAGAEGRDPESANVSLELRDITLQTALKYLCEQVRGGEKLRYQVEDSAIFLLPATETGGELESRSFSLPPSLIAGKKSDNPKELGESILRDIGVNLNVEGASGICFSDTGKLVVRNTSNELNKIEQRIQDAQGEPPQKQFEVETKFLQFTENDLKNFTFNFQMSGNATYPGPGSPGQIYSPAQASGGTDGLRGTSGLNQNGASVVALQSLLDPTYPQDFSNQIGVNARVFGRGFSAILQLLQNSLGKDLVAAPRITIADGKESKIIISRQMFYPTSYTQPNVPNNDQGVGAGFILPSNPTGFESRDIGVTLMVKAESTNIPRAVDLDFTNLVVEDFEGFVDYGSEIATVSFGEGPLTTGSTTVVPPVSSPIGQAPYLVPIFSKRSLQTRIRLLHGETVGMGGLISEAVQKVDDKVPVLGDVPLVGRLFRSEASQRVKSNLVIFCTMRIINPDGSAVFPDEDINPEFAQGSSASMSPDVP